MDGFLSSHGDRRLLTDAVQTQTTMRQAKVINQFT